MIQLSSLKLLDNGLTQAVFADGSVRLYHELIAVDFDGEADATYTNAQLGIALNNIQVAATVDEATQATILEQLNTNAADGVLYVNSADAALADLDTSATSTIYVGDTDDLASLGTFAGIAETTGDFAAATKGDNAFVLTGSDFSADSLADTIAHEAGHLMGTLEHDFGNDGLSVDDFMASTVYTSPVTVSSGESQSFPDAVFDNFSKTAITNIGGSVTVSDSIFSTCSRGGYTSNGGAICNKNSADITITATTFSANHVIDFGGAIYNYGTATITISGSTFSGNTAGTSGGAIYNNSTATISGSTFSGNTSATLGGAIDNDSTGTITVSDSIFSKNTAGTSGGAISSKTNNNNIICASTFSDNYAAYSAGAIYCYNTTIISDSTFNGNTTSGDGGAIHCPSGNSTISNSTFSGNTASQGGAIYLDTEKNLTLQDCTFNGNTASQGGAIYSNGKIIISGTIDLQTPSDTIVTTERLTWDLTDGTATITNYQYVTNTGSLYLKVDNSMYSSYTIATGVEDSLDFSKTSYTLTGLSGTASITVGGSAVTYGSYKYTLTHDTTADTLVLSAQHLRVVIDAGTYKAVDDEIFENLCSPQVGGAIGNYGTAEITDSIFRGNTAGGGNGGGAIYNSGTATISGSTFSGNTSYSHGGAIFSNGYSIGITDSLFTENYSSHYGGAAYFVKTISNSTFTGNTCTYGGGAVRNAQTISHSTFTGNKASGGGGVNQDGLDNNINNCIFIGNSATYNGGALSYTASSEQTYTSYLTCSTFTRNCAKNGGAINVTDSEGSKFSITNSTFTGNTATGNAGAIYHSGNSHLTLTDITFNGNTAANGGGAIYNSSGEVIISGTIDLQTSSDTIYNAGTMTWDLTDGTATITNYQHVTNTGSLFIKMNNSMSSSYTIATGVEDTLDSSKQTFTLTGLSDTQSITVGNSTAVSYGGKDYYLRQVTRGTDKQIDLLVSPVFVNNTWSTNASVNNSFYGIGGTCTTGDTGSFKNTLANAKTAAAGGVVNIDGGSYTNGITGGTTTLHILDGTFTKFVVGGMAKGSAAATEKDNSLTIEGGTFDESVCGSDINTAANAVTRTGNVTLTINGGTFAKRVAGGMFYNGGTATAGAVTLSGNVTLSITGGTFNGRVYGGNNAGTDALGARTTVNGDVNITIDASYNSICFNESVVAGSRGKGSVKGSVSITVKGSGDNLTFDDDSVLFGGCSGDTLWRKADGSIRDTKSNVTGDRTLIFSDFSGDFGAQIKLFKSIEFSDSTVNFTNASLDLASIQIWDFDNDSSITGVATNSFNGDTLNFDEYAGGDKTVMTGAAITTDDLKQASAVTIGGVAATWNDQKSYWATSDNYKLYVDGTSLMLGTIA